MPLTGEYAPSTSDWARKQAELFESTNGAEGGTLMGRPIILLTTLGAKSGKIRKTPLMRVEHAGEYLVVASKGGADTQPGWYLNLQADPEVGVQIRDDRFTARARTATEDERPELWRIMTAAWPAYDEYQEKTDRQIPVVVLERQ